MYDNGSCALWDAPLSPFAEHSALLSVSSGTFRSSPKGSNKPKTSNGSILGDERNTHNRNMRDTSTMAAATEDRGVCHVFDALDVSGFSNLSIFLLPAKKK